MITPDEAQERARRAHRRLRLHDAGLIAFFLLLALAVVVMCGAIGGGPQ